MVNGRMRTTNKRVTPPPLPCFTNTGVISSKSSTPSFESHVDTPHRHPHHYPSLIFPILTLFQPLVQDNGQRRSRSGGEWGQTTGLGAALPAAGGAVVASAAPRVSGDGGEPARGLSDSHRPDLQVRAPAMRAGPRSGFGSDSEYDGGLGTPSTFRA